MMRRVPPVALLAIWAGCGSRMPAPVVPLVPGPDIVRSVDGMALTAVPRTATAHPEAAGVVGAMLGMPVQADDTLPPWCAVLPASAGAGSDRRPGLPGEPPGTPGAYVLQVDGSGAVLRGFDAEGLRNAAATAKQILAGVGCGRRAAPMTIEDVPGLPVRAALLDLARDHGYRRDSMRRLVDYLADLKYTMLVLYLEGRFEIPGLGIRLPGSMTARDARDLDRYARDRGVRIVPQVNLFGHMNELLEGQPEDLREAPGDPYQICPLAPGSRPFLEEVVAALAGAFEDPWLHAGCDEVVDVSPFATCDRCRAYVERHGRGALLAEHIGFLRDAAARHGKRLAVWGDSLLAERDSLGRIPTDIVVFDWHYDPDQTRFPSLETFSGAGFDVVASALAGTVDDFYTGANTGNLGSFFAAAAERGVLGGCACIWEMKDRRIWPQHAYALAYGADCLWSADGGDGTFDRRFNRAVLGLVDRRIPEAWRNMPAMEYRPARRVLATAPPALPRRIEEGFDSKSLIRSARSVQRPLRDVVAACDAAMEASHRPEMVRALRLAARQHLLAAIRVETGVRKGAAAKGRPGGSAFPDAVDAVAEDWLWAMDEHGMGTELWDAVGRLNAQIRSFDAPAQPPPRPDCLDAAAGPSPGGGQLFTFDTFVKCEELTPSWD